MENQIKKLDVLSPDDKLQPGQKEILTKFLNEMELMVAQLKSSVAEGATYGETLDRLYVITINYAQAYQAVGQWAGAEEQ